MKNFIYIVFIAFVIISCKQENKKIVEEKSLSIAEKIASAHGFKNWNKVSTLKFTFNVDKDSIHFERSWTWKTKNKHCYINNKK